MLAGLVTNSPHPRSQFDFAVHHGLFHEHEHVHAQLWEQWNLNAVEASDFAQDFESWTVNLSIQTQILVWNETSAGSLIVSESLIVNVIAISVRDVIGT
jgi:hypothetical protein